MSTEQQRHGPALSSGERGFGLRRRVVRTGVGPIVVRASGQESTTATILLHGAAGSWTTWTPLLRVAELRNVIAVDLPGWGESPAARVSVDQLGDAVTEIARTLGYERWMLVGHSLGGLLALDIAARHPAQTDAVVLVSPSGPAVLAAIRHPVRGGRALPWFAGMLATMRVLASLGPLGTGILRSLGRWGALRPLSAPLFADPAHVHHSVTDALASEIRPRAFADAARAASGYDTSLWRRITCAVRSVRGERDVFVGDEDGAALAALIPDFRQQTLPGAGHFAAVEQPDAVARVLIEESALRRG